jgi:hypothetical protein
VHVSVAPRLLGAGTAAFGCLVYARPDLVQTLCDVEDETACRLLAGVIAARDVVTGVAMLTAPRGRALRGILFARAMLDVGDGIVFGRLTTSPTKRQLARIGGFGFAAICAALVVAERDRGVS